MLTYSLCGSLRDTPGAAVAAAISLANTDYNGPHQKIHIHIMQVIDTGKGWKAIIQISLEPEPAEKSDKVVEKIKEKPALKKVGALNWDQIFPQKTPENIYRTEPASEPSIHIYIPNTYEPGHLYEPHHYGTHPNYHFHFLESDSSFWKVTQEIFPDIDLEKSIYEPAFQLSRDPTLALEIEPEKRIKNKSRLKKPSPEFTGEF